MSKKIEYSAEYGKIIDAAGKMARREAFTVTRRHLFMAIVKCGRNIFARLLGKSRLVMFEQVEQDAGREVGNGNERYPVFSWNLYRVLSLHGGVLGEVVRKVGCEFPIGAMHLGASLLLDPDPDGPVRELLSINGIDADAERVKIIWRLKKSLRRHTPGALSEELRRVAAVRRALTDALVGQADAIEAIGNALFDFWRKPEDMCGRPLSVLIVGPAGSGKSLLAGKLMEALCSIHGIEGGGVTLSGSTFGSDQDAVWEFVGYNSSWKNPKPGFYTKPIADEPRRPICIDHVEKLNPRVLPFVLDAIGKGAIRDEFLDATVDFSKSVCIFIASAGDVGTIVPENENGAAKPTRTRLVEELCAGADSDNDRKNILALAEQCAVVVRMSPLGVGDLKTLISRALKNEAAAVEEYFAKVDVETDRLGDLLLSSADSLDARTVPALVASVFQPVRALLREADCAKRKRKTLAIRTEGVFSADHDEILQNIHARKRQTIEVEVVRNRVKGVFEVVVRPKGYSLLPAIQDGMIRIAPPSDADTFENLVGVSLPLEYARRWKRYYCGETDIAPSNMVFAGPPGTGKTATARAIARYLGVPYCVLDCNDLTSDPGTIVSAFSTIHKYSKVGGMLLFLDEIDAIGCDRDADRSEGGVILLNTLLQQIDGFHKDSKAKPCCCIAATNRVEKLDPALLRPGRFGQTVVFNNPGKEDRAKLLELASSEYGVSISENLKKFVVDTTENRSPATIKAIVREMALSGFTEPTRPQYIKSRQIVVQGACAQGVEIAPEELRAVAIHESGHCLVSEVLGRTYVQAAILSGRSLGFLEERSNGLMDGSREGIMGAICVSLAGRAAEEICGQVTDGCTSDLEKATRLAMRYIREGFSDEYGIGIPPEGLDWKEISSLVRPLLAERYKYVKGVLERERPVLTGLADLLVRKRVVFQDEVRTLRRQILEGRSVSNG